MHTACATTLLNSMIAGKDNEETY